MKEKVPSKSKEGRTPLRSDEKKKVLRRKYDKLKGESLEEQFQNIVETSRSDTVSKIIMNKIKESQSPQVLRVKLEPASCCTPVRPSFAKDFDVAPSPMTPPVPKRMRFSKDMEDAPSPEGMGTTLPSPPPPLKTETLFIKDDSGEVEGETTFFDAQDTSIIDSGNGLNLDGLIYEIFVNHPDCPEDKEKDPLTCATPEKDSEATEADIINEPDLLDTSNKSPTSEAEGVTVSTDSAISSLQTQATEVASSGTQSAVSSPTTINTDAAISTLQDKATEVSSDIYRADTQPAVSPSTVSVDPAVSSPQNKATEVNSEIYRAHTLPAVSPTISTDLAISSLPNKVTEVNHENVPMDTEAAVSCHEESGNKDTTPKIYQDVPSLAKTSTASQAPYNDKISDKGHLLPAVLPILNISADVMSSSSHGSLLEVFLNEEGFHEDFSLSDSQILDIDAQCDLVNATSLQPSADPISKGPQSEGSQVHKSKSLPVVPAPTENPSVVLSKPALDLDFSVPQAPHLDWMQKAAESRQRLRSITQEISRLNAMVLRARRTLWPRPQQDVERQPASTSATGSSRIQPVTSQIRFQPPHVSDLCDDPEWNIS
ncbi:uncharacterized protein LOC117641730 isoform X1 [Thrips palmi]|uniref:Uncharacterized protein LOC117641730 isoform X1 n=1 Tax=Thrips palmi TaxID=161013 RepID=A0A6P8ZJE2_THRPL|nr:uncharacterized protein LOC117641730 isoform X1 [Thrips palmi]